MGRPKVKDGKVVAFFLAKDTIRKIRQMAGSKCLTSSSYLDYLIDITFAKTSIGEKERTLVKEKEILKLERKEIEDRESMVNTEIKRLQEIKPINESLDKEYLIARDECVLILVNALNKKYSLSDLPKNDPKMLSVFKITSIEGLGLAENLCQTLDKYHKGITKEELYNLAIERSNRTMKQNKLIDFN